MDRRRKLLRNLVIVALLALLVVSVGAFRNWWQHDGDRPNQPPVLLSLQPITLATGLHLLGGMAPSAVYVVETSDGLVLVDAGLDPDGKMVTEQMTVLGLDPARVRAVLLTHIHGDHSQGAMHFRRSCGARIYAGQADCAALRAGGPLEAFFANFPPPGTKLHPTQVDVELIDGQAIEVGDTRLQAVATPGHTPGSTCYLLERDGRRVLFTGDVVSSLGDAPGPASAVEMRGPLGTYTAYLPPRYRGNARDYLASLQKLRDLPAPDMVLPGHPRNDATPANARATPERWRAILDRGIREMQDLVAHYDADGANFLDGKPKQILPGLHYLGDRGGLAVYCLITNGRLFLFDAPGGPGLVRFLESGLRDTGLTSTKPTAVLLTSCGPEATGGLKELIAQTGCKVVAPQAGRAAVKAICPPETVVLTEDELIGTGWIPVRVVKLAGRGVAPVAYEVKLQGKTVLVSGRMPVKLSPRSVEELLRSLGEPGGDKQGYANSLRRLEALTPAVWLPLAPVDGQNANLYGREWADLLAGNRGAVQHGFPGGFLQTGSPDRPAGSP